MKKPNERMGNGKKGGEDCKKHKFYKQIDWDGLLSRDVQPPYDPFINFDEDTSNFDEYPESKGEAELPDLNGASDPFLGFSTI